MKRFRNYYLALLPALMLSGVASAATLVVNCSTVSGSSDLTAAAILCPQFNLGGGFGVSNIGITVSGGVTGSITLTNGDDAAHTGTGTSTTSFNFGPLTGFSFVNPIFTASFTTGTRALAAGQTLTVAGLSGTGGGSLGNDTTSFATYSGSGNFTIPVSTSTLFSNAGGGGFFKAAQVTSPAATAVVTYTYSAVGSVPEPTTISLLGVGLLGFGLIGRKFTARK